MRLQHSAYIGLGSNLQSPLQQLQQALQTLNQLPGCQLVKVSSFYRSAPLGPQDQDDFVNAVALLKTALTPLDLLKTLQSVELQQGRQRLQHWGPRTLDLDILLYDDLQMDHEDLQIPHPQLSLRSFVLLPLAEIGGDSLQIPGMGKLVDLIRSCPQNPIHKMPAAESFNVAVD